jgi:hypothetical protein
MSFFLELKGKRLLLHEDNQSVVKVLTHLTSRSPAMMSELRNLFLLTDKIDVSIRAQYIRSASNIRADKLNKETYTLDWQLARRVFQHLDTTYHKHTIDRFASRKKQRATTLQREVERRQGRGGGLP